MFVLATAGHVDHGKSTLVQRLTGIDPDRWAEEKRRGLTIDLGFAWLTLADGAEVGIVDVPGHERFVANMLAGVGMVPAVLFVVDATEGWKPQTEEHLQILDLLEVRHAVVVLTKVDAVDRDVVLSRQDEVRGRVAGTTLAAAQIVPVSAKTGEGIDELLVAVTSMFASMPPRKDGRMRMFIDRVFTIDGAGTVVTGTLAEGTLRVGDEVRLAPGSRTARVRAIQAHRASREALEPVARAAVNLAGLNPDEAARGDAIVAGDGWRMASTFDAYVRTVRAGSLVEGRSGYTVHLGTSEVPASIRFGSGQGERGSVEPGGVAIARISLRDPLPVVALDRFIVRDTGRRRVVAGGVVLEPAPNLEVAFADVVPVLEARAMATTPDEMVAHMLQSDGVVDLDALLARTGTSSLPSEAERLGPFAASAGAAAEVRERVRTAVELAHSREPLARGVGREPIRRDLGMAPVLFDAVLADPRTGVVAEGVSLRSATFEVALDAEQEIVAERVIAEVADGELRPPDRVTLAAPTPLIDELVRRGRLVGVGPDLVFAPEAFDAAIARVRAALADGPRTTSDLRQVLATSRKYAIPLLERFDADGVTRFDGERRHRGE